MSTKALIISLKGMCRDGGTPANGRNATAGCAGCPRISEQFPTGCYYGVSHTSETSLELKVFTVNCRGGTRSSEVSFTIRLTCLAVTDL
jgi:hypothetical protein